MLGVAPSIPRPNRGEQGKPAAEHRGRARAFEARGLHPDLTALIHGADEGSGRRPCELGVRSMRREASYRGLASFQGFSIEAQIKFRSGPLGVNS
jgi:hypothetical protein